MNVVLFLRTLAETAAMACCLVVPGAVLLRLFLRDDWPRLPAFRRMGLALIVSSPIVAAFEGLVFVLPAPAMRALGRLVVAACVVAVFFWLRRPGTLRRAWASPRRGLALCLTVLLFAGLAIVVTSDLPGPFEGYGDVAAYYRVIDNLSQGREPLVDFRASDYIGGDYFLPVAYPLPTYLAGFMKTVFPGSRHHLAALSILIGLAGCFICGGRLAERAARGGSPLAVLSAGLVALLPAGNAQALALGGVSLPAFTFAAITFDVAAGAVLSPPRRWTLVAACAAITAAARPEGALLVVLATAAAGVCLLLRLAGSGPLMRRGAAVAVLAGGAVLAFFLPYQRVLGAAPSSFYLHYFDDTGEFSLRRGTGVFWYHIMEDNAREDLGLERRRTRLNPDFMVEARSHPVAYGRWLAGVVRDRVGWPSLAVFGFCVTVLGLGRWPPGRVLAITAPVYVIVLAAINEMFMPRHTLPLMTILAVEAVASRGWLSGVVLGRVTRLPVALSATVLLALPLVIWNGHQAYELRRLDRASAYNDIFRDLRRFSRPDSVVASTFPRLIGYGADARAVGNSELRENLAAVVAAYSPDLILLDDARPDLEPNYEAARELLAQGRFRQLGYELLADNPARRYMTLGSAAHRGPCGPPSSSSARQRWSSCGRDSRTSS